MPETGSEQTSPGINNKVNLVAETKAVRDTLVSNQEIPVDEIDPDTWEKWNAQKTERNALTSMMINRVFKRTLAHIPERAPMGLLAEKTNDSYIFATNVAFSRQPKSYFVRESYGNNITARNTLSDENRAVLQSINVAKDIRSTLYYDLLQEIEGTKALPEEDFNRRVYERLNAMTHLPWNRTRVSESGDVSRERSQPFTNNGKLEVDWVENFIYGGLETTVNMMGGAMLTMIALYHKEHGSLPSPKELSGIAKNSLAIFSKIASLHLENLDVIDDLFMNSNTQEVYRIGDGGQPGGYPLSGMLKPEYFELKQRADGQTYMMVNDEKWSGFLDQMNNQKIESVTTGCPALASLDEETQDGQKAKATNVIKEIWNWYSDIVGNLDQYSQPVQGDLETDQKAA